MGTSRAFPSVCQVLLHTGQLLVRVLAFGAAALLAVWLLYIGTLKYTQDKPWQVFPPDYGCDSRLLFDACTVKDLVLMWLAPALLALASMGLLLIRAALKQEAEGGQRKGPLGKLGSRLLPPKRLWLWWCGGVSVSDGLVVAFWVAFNAAWGLAVLGRFFSLIPFFERIAQAPKVLLELQLVAVAFGVLLLPNFVLLFYPVTRGSVVLQAAGISYPDAIRYHRWLGHAVMVFATSHSLGFWGIWLYQGTFLKEALDQGPVFNNLAGGVSFLGGLALWLSSLEVARRANYELFYKLHHIGFWIFTFAGCCHYWEMFWYFLPGLMLYGVDGVYRIHQGLGFWGSTGSGADVSKGSGEVQVLEAAVSAGHTTCSLMLAAPSFGAAASGFVWLNVPHDISWHSWHPFEYFAVPTAAAAAGGGGETALLLHIKAYDRWTKQLLALVAAKGVNFTVKIEGPYAELPGAVLGHPEVSGGNCCKDDAAAAAAAGDIKANGAVAGSNGSKSSSNSSSAAGHHESVDGLIIAAGGVGATAAMSVFQELATSGEAVRGLPTLIVWCCRKADEFEFLAPRLMAMAATLGLDTTVRLFCTGNPATTNGAALSAANSTRPHNSTRAPAPTPNPATRDATGPTAPSRHHDSSSSSIGLVTSSSMCPVVSLRSWWCQAAHKTLLHVLAFAGTLAAILAIRYWTEVQPALAGLEPWTTGQKGALHVTLISAAILLPGFLALWAALAVQAWQQRSTAAAAAGSSGSNGSSSSCCSQQKKSQQAGEVVEPLLLSADQEFGSEEAAGPNDAAAAGNKCSSVGSWGAASAVAAAAAATTGVGSIRPAAAGGVGGWELVLPAGVTKTSGASGDGTGEGTASATATATATAAARGDDDVITSEAPGCDVFSVECGRPPLNQLITAWLTTRKQLPTADTAAADAATGVHGPQQPQQLQFSVFGMGPGKLVEDVKLMCDVINGQQQRSGQSVWLNFVQKTHEL